MKSRRINVNVPFITRLEGEGALELVARGDEIERLHLKIFEPPRLFEKFLEGKSYEDIPDLNARICGICPMAYQLTSILAIEKLFQVKVSAKVTQLRRLMNLGEWIQSHALHIHFLAAPDFLGFDHALAMAKAHPDVLKRGMQIQEAGNSLMTLLGGRSVHPVGLQVGGFGRFPSPESWQQAALKVNQALPLAEVLLRWAAALPLPDYSHDFLWVSLKDTSDYPINGGEIVVSDGTRLSHEQYQAHFAEHQVRHSTALYSLFEGKDYLVGPLARLNNNVAKLPKPIKALLKELGVKFPNTNPFTSIVARCVEIYMALLEAQTILAQPCPQGEASVKVQPRAGQCCCCTEAPRGMIYHYYELDEKGRVVKCSIIPPTSQNQARIEQDLRQSVARFGLSHSDDELKRFCEQVIRNYDPCISCSTHFLDFSILRH
ncbi:Ni/Fe hydrogenase subunit alpha [Aliiglaciecola sp. CAU 1673]|uniref:Ni/Fe hydrogenase subunit alpha n=1 Tax=Aliiglaciecola sp. CAU 1673 TaxID=3032595 RepID=UPI0023DB2EBD|nr:Ni/Fe hydrogenase subunit alpha [Aliiglaciecola sp. CAU 1673]MDF2180194.1 Ni/Fe hydrogenase subunit alpha [Aliiglaciecola sp. CAU 1673]